MRRTGLVRMVLAAVGMVTTSHLFAAPTINQGQVVTAQIDGNPVTSQINLRAEGVISGGAPPVRILPESVQLLFDGEPVGSASVQGDLCITLDAIDPNGNQEGDFPYTLTFRVTDDDGGVFPPLNDNPATITIEQGSKTAFPSCKDRAAPVVGPDGPFSAAGTEDTPLDINAADLLKGVRDPNGDSMTVVSVQNAVGGTVVLNGGIVTFTPNQNANGSNFSFQYLVQDVDGDSLLATANLTFVAVNDAPQAVSSACTVGIEGGVCPLQISDPEGDTLTFELQTQPSGGVVDVASFDPASRTVVYTPSSETTSDSFTYVVVDAGGARSNEATVTITVTQQDQNPTARLIIRDRNNNVVTPPNLPDTDNEPGESVTLDGATSTPGVPPSAITTWTFTVNGQVVSSQDVPTFPVTLQDGQNVITLVVTDSDDRQSEPVTVTLNVGGVANQPPQPDDVVIMINGSVVTTEVFVENADFEPGESVTLDGSESVDPEGDELTFEWALVSGGAAEVIAETATATVRLPDGSNRLRLTITDSAGNSAFREVTVNVQSDPNLGGITGLDPNQAAVARAIDELCPRMNALDPSSLTDDQEELLTRCNNLIAASESSSQQRAALEALTGEELTTAQRTGLNISNLNLTNVGARLNALRGGATGLNFAGLTVIGEGKRLPLQELAQLAKDLIGSAGGASGEEEGGGLLDRRLGIFINGRVGFGEKDRTQNESGYDIDTYGITLGADYRFTDRLVLGLAAGWGSSKSKFDNDGGSLESDGYSLSFYGSHYGERYYFDLIATYATLDHESERRISYTLPTEPQPINLTALGEADGRNISGGLSFGYNFGRKGWTFGPTLALTYVDVQVDGFAETGAGGLNLQFGEQRAQSFQMQAGAQIGYAFSRSWGVLSPQARISFIRENQDDAESILVRFVADPFVDDLSQPSSTTFLITTDAPDSEFLQWGVGLSAVFRNGISGFINYEAFAGLNAIEYGEVTVGLRFEREF